MQAAVGISSDDSAARAALDAGRSVLAGLRGRSPDWVVVFLTSDYTEHLEAVTGTLASLFDTEAIVGCTAASVLTGAGECEGRPAIGILGVCLADVEARPFLIEDEGGHGVAAGIRIGQSFSGANGSNDAQRLVLAWPDAFHVRPDYLLQSLAAAGNSIPVVGGASSSRPEGRPRRQFCGTRHSAAAVAGISLEGPFQYHVEVTQGCRPLGQPLEITRSHDNMILELDRRPALDLLRERVTENGEPDLAAALDRVFVGLLPLESKSDSDYLVRNITHVDPDTGVLTVNDRVVDDQHVVFVQRTADAARADLARALERAQRATVGMEPVFGLYFNCRARGHALYGERDVDVAEIRKRFPDLPLLGFFCNAEIGPLHNTNQLFTYTGVLLIVGR